MSYQEAVRLLNGRKAAAKPTLDEMRGSDDMMKWLEILGYDMHDLNNLNMIHVAGTNGKGSTCTYIELFLRLHGIRNKYPQNTGLYTSPHVKNIRERIRLNGTPISENQFATNFFEIWAKLPQTSSPSLDIPRYLQILALLAFHTFIKAQVDVFVCETHMGGQYDATNVVESPAVTALSSIAKDHVKLLGSTLERIAWHKSGIFKPQRPVFSTCQQEPVVLTLESRATEKDANLTFVEHNHELTEDSEARLSEPQKRNCSLAISVASSYLRERSQGFLSAEIIKLGIRQWKMPGRFQKLIQTGIEYYIDGAHNESGMIEATTWFLDAIKLTHRPSILLFRQFSDRDITEILRTIFRVLDRAGKRIDYVIFCANISNETFLKDRASARQFSPDKQSAYVKTWQSMDAKATIRCAHNIDDTLNRVKNINNMRGLVHVFVTGSLSFVGGVLEALEDRQMMSNY